MKDRRSYFRIDDSIILNYRIVPESEVQRALEWQETGMIPRQDAQSTLDCIDRRLQDELGQLDALDPRLATVLDLINKKIELLSRIVKTEGAGLVDQPAREVNLSAGGVSFCVESALPEGAIVELRLVLFPSYTYIRGYGKVVSCRGDNDAGSEFRHRVAVSFDCLQEDDREAIIQHVLKKQSARLKDSRQHEPSLGLASEIS